MRDSIVFYRSFYDAIKNLPRDIQGEIYTAIMEYSLYGNETDNLKPISRSVFTLIKPQIDANNKRFENGRKGGRPKKSEEPNGNQEITKEKPSNNQNENKSKPNVNDNVNDNKKESINIDKKDAAKAATHSRKQEFSKSLIPYVEKYGNKMIRDFFDYWSEMNKSCSKMRFEQQPTWELSKRLATWSKREKKYGTKETITSNIYEQKRIDSERRKSQLMAEFEEADAKFLAEQEAKRKTACTVGEISDTFTDGI